MEIDREYYIAALMDKFNSCNINALEKALDKTIEDYTFNGELQVEDWDMFDQNLYFNAEKELEKTFNI